MKEREWMGIKVVLKLRESHQLLNFYLYYYDTSIYVKQTLLEIIKMKG